MSIIALIERRVKIDLFAASLSHKSIGLSCDYLKKYIMRRHETCNFLGSEFWCHISVLRSLSQPNFPVDLSLSGQVKQPQDFTDKSGKHLDIFSEEEYFVVGGGGIAIISPSKGYCGSVERCYKEHKIFLLACMIYACLSICTRTESCFHESLVKKLACVWSYYGCESTQSQIIAMN